MARRSQGGQPQDGIGGRVRGAIQRAVGAAGRAVRGAAGAPEAGTDVLFQVLHAEHEEVNQLFVKVLGAEDPGRIRTLWKELATKLTLHARAEEEAVYERLERLDATRAEVGHAVKEHAEMDRLLAEANGLEPGSTAFEAKVTELQDSVRHHVDDEEGELLPRAARALSDEEREALVARFRALKEELAPEIDDTVVDAAPKAEHPRAKSRPKTPGKANSTGTGKGKGKGSSALAELPVKELRAMARDEDIPGRSKMKKAELVRALTRR